MKQQPPISTQRGYTLIELLIVVALLATLVSLALPSLRKLSQKGQLQNAARQLRAELLAARLEAIESAACTYFYYQPESGKYTLTHAAEEAIIGDVPAAILLGEVAGERPDDDMAVSEEPSQQTLAPGIRFLDNLADDELAQAESAMSGGESGRWSEPLAFYPNGRALNCRIRLASDRYWIELMVRGLTGTVQISPVQRFSESSVASPHGQPGTDL